ncbi:MAG: hypothetical protein GWO21_12245, partial [Gammaproteobacteria bacterium]|nr:hypothetical protein [Gammaproteobacteria bacterium]NIX05434.1 hypothetical protein [Gammaproteobacteria bacterium]
AEPDKVRDIQSARIEQLNRYVGELQERRERLARELRGIAGDLDGADSELKERAGTLDAEYEEKEQSATE